MFSLVENILTSDFGLLYTFFGGFIVAAMVQTSMVPRRY